MTLTEKSLRNPAAIAVVVALIALFGALAMYKLPIQLLPNISQPQITVFNNWREAAPAEVEANIVEPQESILRFIPGVTEITSNVSRGSGRITLTFDIDTDMQDALIRVINAVNQAPPLPVDADEPFVAGGAGFNSPMAASLLIRPLPNNPNQEMASYQKLIDETVQPRLTRIPGVSQVRLNSQRPKQIHIKFDPYKAAALGIRVEDIAEAIGQAVDVSGGFADVGRRQYTVRVVGQQQIDEMDQLIIGWSGNRPLYLREVAEIEVGLSPMRGFTLRNGYPAYYIQIQRENDSNTVDILDRINLAIDELNAGPLLEAGLTMDLSYDSSVYIRRAISLVQTNLGLGVMLAVGVLWFFLRSVRVTLLIALAIPVSLLVAFIALESFGLTLNVISLAGLAFAVGLVLDAAIIVQENIVRYRQSGEHGEYAVLHGTSQVSGALFASTLTSVAIFLPVLFMQGMEGQLFADLALTLSVAVLASWAVAMTVLPVASSRWLSQKEEKDPMSHWWDNVTVLMMKLTDNRFRRSAWIGGLLVSAVAITVLLMPKADFLPSAKADAVQTFFSLPAGSTVEMLETEIAAEMVRRLKPYMDHEQKPYIKGYNLSIFGSFSVLFLYPEEPDEVDDFLALLRDELLVGLPDTQAFPSRASLLSFGFNGGRTINVDLQGPDIDALMAGARIGMQAINEFLPGAVARPLPGLSISEPELQIDPNERQIAQAGLNQRSLASAVRAMTGGLFVGEYFDGNDRMDMILKSGAWSSPEAMAAMPISTPLSGVQTIGSLATITRTVGPSQLQRVDGQRTVSLQVIPSENMTVEETLAILRSDVGPKIYEALPSDAGISYRGSADRLEGALKEMRNNFLLAILILFMIMAAIFRSLRDSFLVLMVMPLALAGGVLALRLLNIVTYQSMDLLTMIGFIILLGLVVNNAILLVIQTRHAEKDKGYDRRSAVADAIRIRARPVYMSTLTSIFGMLPLVVIPGVGSDVYRGLAAVIVGGMMVSAAFTLVLLPSLLRIGEERRTTIIGAGSPGQVTAGPEIV
ncbi:MAG: efflux RND transporter permease subunit [Gammaproteobacteria bacterium]|nr:efflux RND transporter permease subunit [Gammaproteobacteria bacterium]